MNKKIEVICTNINGLLERLETFYNEVSEFSAKVAHELKTPVTLMRLQLEESVDTIQNH